MRRGRKITKRRRSLTTPRALGHTAEVFRVAEERETVIVLHMRILVFKKKPDTGPWIPLPENRLKSQ